MRRHLILTILACGLHSLIASPALAQTDDPLAEAHRMNIRSVDLLNADKYNEAIEPCQRALVIRRESAGQRGTLLVATSLNNLASLYQGIGDYAEAEPLFQRALALKEKLLGKETSGCSHVI